MEYRSRSKTSIISGYGMLIRGVVKFSARNCQGINFRKVGNYRIAGIFRGVKFSWMFKFSSIRGLMFVVHCLN